MMITYFFLSVFVYSIHLVHTDQCDVCQLSGYFIPSNGYQCFIASNNQTICTCPDDLLSTYNRPCRICQRPGICGSPNDLCSEESTYFSSSNKTSYFACFCASGLFQTGQKCPPEVLPTTLSSSTAQTNPTIYNPSTITSTSIPVVTNTPITMTSNTPITATSNTPITVTSNAPNTRTSSTPITVTSNAPTTATSNTPITVTSNTPITATSNTPITVTSNAPTTATSNTPIPTTTLIRETTVFSSTVPTTATLMTSQNTFTIVTTATTPSPAQTSETVTIPVTSEPSKPCECRSSGSHLFIGVYLIGFLNILYFVNK